MSLEKQISDLIDLETKNLKKYTDEYDERTAFIKGKGKEVDEFIELSNDNFPSFNLIPNAKLNITDDEGNFVPYGFSWWTSRMTPTIERFLIKAANWSTSHQYGLRLTVTGPDVKNVNRYGALWAGSGYGTSNPIVGQEAIRTTRAFEYRVVSQSGNGKAYIGWETGKTELDMEISKEWKFASKTTKGFQTNPLISFYLEQNETIVIEITNMRINLGTSDRMTYPLNTLAKLALED